MSRVAKRYSKALFELALEVKKMDQINEDLKMIRTAIDSSVELRALLENPLVQARQKSRLVAEIFKGKIETLTCNFLQLLCSKKRSEFLPEVIDKFSDLYLDYKGIIEGQIICAQSLAKNQLEIIGRRINEFTGKKVILTQVIDKDLIGGFIVKIKDTVIDLSVKNQLLQLREKLIFG